MHAKHPEIAKRWDKEYGGKMAATRGAPMQGAIIRKLAKRGEPMGKMPDGVKPATRTGIPTAPGTRVGKPLGRGGFQGAIGRRMRRMNNGKFPNFAKAYGARGTKPARGRTIDKLPRRAMRSSGES